MIRKGDIRWWVLEAREHPESAPAIIEEIAGRLVELDAENERLRNEAILAERRPAEAVAASELRALRERIAVLEAIVEAASPEHSLVLLSGEVRSARLPLAQVETMVRAVGPTLSAGALTGLRCLVLARSGDDVLMLTSQGRGRVMHTSEAPLVDEDSLWPPGGQNDMPADEWLAAATTTGCQPRFWTVITRRGFVRQVIRIAFERAAARGGQVIDMPHPRDEPRAIVSGDQDDLLIVTRWGKGLRIPRRAIPSQGTVAIELDLDDEVASALPLQSDTDILIVTAAGFAVRRDTSAIKAMARPGGTGRPLIRAFDVSAIFPYSSDAQVLFLTHSGRLVLAPVADVPPTQHYGKGHRLADLSRDPAVAAVCVPARAWPKI